MKENILENEGYVLIGSAKEIQARLGRPLETDVIALFRDSGDDEQATVLTELVRHVTIDFERKLHQRKRQAMSRVIDSYVEFVSLDKTALLDQEDEKKEEDISQKILKELKFQLELLSFQKKCLNGRQNLILIEFSKLYIGLI